jgi:hypothetical protein
MLRTLFYWDKLYSIVPVEYSFDNTPNGHFMREMVQGGLVEPLIPSDYLYQIPNFERAFLEYIHPIHSVVQGSPKRDLLNQKTSRIHTEKLNALGEDLVALGLANKSEMPWYKTPDWLAAHFMTFYALTLGRLGSVNAAAVTDNEECFRIVCDERPVGKLDVADTARSILIDKMLPAPITADMNEIVEFKDKHGDQLHRFRRRIEKAVREVVAQPDEASQREAVEGLKGELEDEKAEVSARMTEWFEKVIIWPFLIATAAVLKGPNAGDSNPIASYTLIAVQVAFAAQQSVAAAKDYRHALKDPLAYAALYDKRGWKSLRKSGGRRKRSELTVDTAMGAKR